tara:strand:+ start:1423 stop:2007 length:585 start_codon:yes stop_codon:yes gene_type:complete
MRTLAGTTTTQLLTGKIRPAHLIEINLGDSQSQETVVLITDYHIDVTYDNKTYIATGHLLNLTEISTSNDLQIHDLTIALSGVDLTKISIVLSYDYIDREVTIQRALMTSEDAVYATPVTVFRGRINNPSIADDVDSGELTVTLSATSQLADFDRTPARHTNHLQHQYHYPDDDFFSLWGQIDKEIVWGFKADT